MLLIKGQLDQREDTKFPFGIIMDISISEQTQNEEVVQLDLKQVIFFPLTPDDANFTRWP